MNRFLLVSLVVVLMTPGVAPGQSMGRGGNDAPPRLQAQHEMRPQMPAPGMMAPGPDLMGGCMMKGGTTGSETMPSMMSSMMDGMMPGKTRGCMMMAEGMMKGQIDLAQMRKALALSDEQVERLRAGQRPFQKETILTLASLRVAELELADLLAADKADFGKIEAKLKEIEGLRTKVRLSHIKATVAVKAILSAEQLDRLQGVSESTSPFPAPTPAGAQQGAPPPVDSGHEQHH